MGRTGQGAGVRDRGKKNKRVEWSEKWSKGRGWQGGGEAEGGQEEDWEVVCVTRASHSRSTRLRETSRPQGPVSLPPWEPSAWLGLTCWWLLSAASSSMLSVNSVLASSVSSPAGVPGSKSRRER